MIDAVEAPKGKWPTVFGNVVVIEASYLAVLLRGVVQVRTARRLMQRCLYGRRSCVGAH